jgi:hypothetical protein
MPFPVLPAFSYRRVERRAVREGRLEDDGVTAMGGSTLTTTVYLRFLPPASRATVLAIVLYTGVARVLLYLFPGDPGARAHGALYVGGAGEKLDDEGRLFEGLVIVVVD